MRVIPPFFIAVLMLASPVANTRIPQASERPTLEPPVADPAATGPFSWRVMGAMTGAFPIVAHPVKNPTQTAVTANRRASFFMTFLSVEGRAGSDASSTVTGGAHGDNASPPRGGGGHNDRPLSGARAAMGRCPSTTRARPPAPTANLATFRERAGRGASGTLDALSSRRSYSGETGVTEMTYDAYGVGSDHWSDRRARALGRGGRRSPGRADAGRRGSDRSAPSRSGGSR